MPFPNPTKIENIKIEELIPYKDNQKFHPEEQINKIIKSIEKFGWTNDILAIKHKGKNLVIAGHARLEAAKKLKMEKVPVKFLNLSYENAVAHNIADNKLAELAEWDMDLVIGD